MTLYLVVGLPAPYDALVRSDHKGETCIIIDLYRILTYTGKPEDLPRIIRGFLTHELVHIMNHKVIVIEDKTDKEEILKYIYIDEGLAHYLAYLGSDMGISIDEAINLGKMDPSKKKMAYYLDNPGQINQEVIMQACSGAYWDKFVCLDGMRAIHERNKQGRLTLLKKASVKKMFDAIYLPTNNLEA